MEKKAPIIEVFNASLSPSSHIIRDIMIDSPAEIKNHLKFRMSRVPPPLLFRVLQSRKFDSQILLDLQKLYEKYNADAISHKKWGKEITTLTPTGKGRKIAREIDMLLGKFRPLSLFDFGTGNGEIGYSVGNYFRIKNEKIYLGDVTNTLAQGYKNLNFVDLTAKTPVKPESIDLVICIHVLHHIPLGQIPAALKKIKSMLKPDGILLVREHNCDSVLRSNILDIIHAYYDIVLEKKPYSTFLKEYFANYFSREYFFKMLEGNGFQLKCFRYEKKDDAGKSYYATFTIEK